MKLQKLQSLVVVPAKIKDGIKLQLSQDQKANWNVVYSTQKGEKLIFKTLENSMPVKEYSLPAYLNKKTKTRLILRAITSKKCFLTKMDMSC
ncbi:MAG: hypothetical protein ACI976_001659 [Aureispira sp.]|jgi:hypothetical protein